MSVEQRIRTCRLIEKMRAQKLYSGRLGLENVSTVHGKKINDAVCEKSGKDKVI